jgi:serine/threonine-protein kinase
MISAGEQIGRYRIRSAIGKGGMGEVFLADDTELERLVALKVLPEDLANDTERMRRFVQEAKSASALNHPNIITIHEIGKTDNTHFIATEYIEGETLHSRLKSEQMNLKSVLDIGIQVASALDAAHRAGIVHRDIKPENVMIRPDGVVKILDFGIAKLTEKKAELIDAEAATAIKAEGTSPGMIIGTAAYMSPEQARGKDIDARSDVFSFGVVLYEMLAGKQAFEGESAIDTISAIIHKDPVPLNQITSDVPRELQHIVEKSLRKDRDERYQTAKDLLIDLRDVRQDLQLQNQLERTAPPNNSNESKIQILSATTSDASHATSSAEYIAAEIKQHKRGFVVGLAILLLAAIGLGYWLFANRSANVIQIESIAVLPFVNESGNVDNEYLSDGMTETLISTLQQLPNLLVKARSSVFRYKGKEIDPKKIGQELLVQAVLFGRVIQRGEQLTLSLELIDARTENVIWSENYNRKQADLVSLQSEIARDVANKLRVKLSGADEQKLTKNYTANTDAWKLYSKGVYFWNKFPAKEYERSREYFEQAIDVDPTYALAYSGLADYYGFRANNGIVPPNENWLKAEAAANKALALDESLGEAHNALAAVKMHYYRDWDGAEREFKRAVELSPNYSEAHQLYGTYLAIRGRSEEGLAEKKKALELDPLSVRLNRNLARAFYWKRDYDRAIEQYQKTLELAPNNAFTHILLGYAFEQKGMQKEAVAEWSKALRLTGDNETALMLTNDGEAALMLERTFAASGFDAAVRSLWQKELEQLNEKTRSGEYVPAMNYALTYTRLADKEQAFAWLTKAEEERNWLIFQGILDPQNDSLRSDPRFQDLLRRVGFTP